MTDNTIDIRMGDITEQHLGMQAPDGRVVGWCPMTKGDDLYYLYPERDDDGPDTVVELTAR